MRMIVDKNGGGHFQSVQEAIHHVPDHLEQLAVIEIKNGIYREKLTVPQTKGPIHMIGESAEQTILVYQDNAHTPGPDGEPLGTFRSGSFYVYADDFRAENLTIRNDSGPRTGQAVAAFLDADRAAFRNIRFEGDQDTLYAAGGRHYYLDCYIEGDVDFIFGPATAVFDNCHIHCKRTGGYLTAANTPQDVPYGFVFLDCQATGGPGVEKVWLGRPWRDYAAVTFIRTDMDESIHPLGWHNWSKPEREQTSRYAEFGSFGPGGSIVERVAWADRLSEEEAAQFTVRHVLSGSDQWRPPFA